MYCQNCGKKNNNDSQFCMNCGKKLAPVNDNGDVMTKEVQKSETHSAKPFAGKISLKNLIFGGLVACILIVLIFSSVLGSGGSGKVLGILYIKDSELHMTNNDKAGESFSDEEPLWKGLAGPKGEYVYFLDDFDYDNREGDLKLKKLGKDVVEIEDKVYEHFVVSPSGRRVLFLTDFDGYYVGELYLSVDGKKPEKLAEDVFIKGFAFGEDETEVAYVSEFDIDKYSGTLFFKKEGKEAEQIDDDINFPVLIGKGGNEIYFAKDFNYRRDTYDLYLISGKSEIDRIARDISAIVYNKDFSKSLDFSQDEDWETTLELRKRNEDGEEIDDKITDIYNVTGILNSDIRYMTSNTGRLYHVRDSQDLFAIYVEDNDKIYVFKEGFEPVKLADYEDVKTVVTDKKCNLIAYIDYDNETLYAVTFKKGQLTEPQKIDDDVSMARITEDGKNIVYLKDYRDGGGELFVASLNGDSEKIADDVFYNFVVSKDGKEFVFVDEDDNLFYARRGKDKQEIAEDVDVFGTVDFKTIYYRDYSNELFKVKVGNEPISIDDDVELFMLMGDF